jgi:signal transduction histidine kinase/tetratricopeptide (TPR) repeat protein
MNALAPPTPQDALDFFATDDALAGLEDALAQAVDDARLPLLIAVAWQLRQRDTQRALALVEEVNRLFNAASPADISQRRTAARLLLIKGEAQWLQGDLRASSDLAEQALATFTDLGDATGSADAHWLQAWIASDVGDSARMDAALQDMLQAAQHADPVRATVAQATIARFDAFRDVLSTQQRWGPQFAETCDGLHPAASCAVEDFRGILLSNLSSDYAQSIRHHIRTYSLALATGQVMRAIITATNLGEAFDDLNDHHAAMGWMRKGLELARASGWPATLGNALMQTAGTLRYLHRLDTAHAMLREALELLAPMASSRAYAIALRHLGDVEHSLQQYDSALAVFQRMEQSAIALDHADLLSHALLGQARVRLQLGQSQLALEKAHAALAAAHHWANYQISALRVLADIHAQDPTLAPPPVNTADNATLHYLLRALELASTIEKFTVPGDLLEEVARAYAKIGRMDCAYEKATQASEAREKTHSAQAISRANAMQVTHETERVRAEAEHHRQLAAVHAERADTLMQAKSTLEQLGEIGREITGNLNTDAIFSTLHRHVHDLLDVTTFAIDRLEPDGQTLHTVFGVEDGHALPPYHYRIDEEGSNDARCARERVEIVVNSTPDHNLVVPGTLITLSSMFAPLQVGDRLLGVMTVQSVRANAYTEREVAIFRTLCAYGAIALANSEAQARLLQSQKMASLGRLVAGVSHELNTPLGNGLMAVTTLRDNLHAFQKSSATTGLKRQAFEAFLASVEEGSMIALRSMDRSASLVRSFKQIAVDRTSAPRRVFLLAEVLSSVRTEFQSRLDHSPYQLTMTAAPDLQMDSFAEALCETLVRLLDNAIAHGFNDRDHGNITIDCQLCDPDHVRITVNDDGRGIALSDQGRIFDPFFTTRLGQFSGLGLHIVHNNITQLLAGTLALCSRPAEGCEFDIILPLIAPRHATIG